MFTYILILLTLSAYSRSEEPELDSHLSFTLVSYTTWVGDEKPHSVRSTLDFAKKNDTLFHVMEHVAKKDPNFVFEYKEFEGLGRYITSIGGLAEDKETDHYWMVYKLKHFPNPYRPPTDDELSPVGM